MPGRKELRSIRLRREATPGTPETPRYLWRGNGDMLHDAREITPVEEQVGVFGGGNRTYTAKLLGELSLAETPATFEQLPDLFLAAGFRSAYSNLEGTRYATGSTVAWLLFVPTTAVPTSTSTYTIEAGEPDTDSEAEVMPYSVVSELSLSGVGGEALMVSSQWQGRYVARTNDAGSFSAVGTLPSVETIIAGKGTIYLAVDGNNPSVAGSRVPSGNVLAVSLSFKPKWAWKYPVDFGTIYPYQAVYTGMDIDGEVTFEHQTGGSWSVAGTGGLKDAWRNETPMTIDLLWRGGTITSGTIFTNKSFRVQLPIRWTTFDVLGDQDGNSTITGKFISKYSTDATSGITGNLGAGLVQIARSGTSEFAGA